jgi:hypothetical protein
MVINYIWLSTRGNAARAGLVWTGPEGPGMTSRDTGVVVRELLSTAERSVLIAGFVVFDGKQVFKPLSDRMYDTPSLQVRLFLNVSCALHDRRTESEILREFGDDFRRYQWTGENHQSAAWHLR